MNMSNVTECFECGMGTLMPNTVDLTGLRHGEEFTVRANGLQCTECGFKTIDNEQSGEFTKLVSDAYRQKHGLLTSAEIRAARKRLRMSQQEFARYLKVGLASVKRWENGQIQDEAMNELILVKTDLSAAIDNCQTLKQKSATGAGIVAALFGDEVVEVFLPFEDRQFRKQKSAFTLEGFETTEVYAPSC
jgi:putative zinc finger/helix-turn-helix YgiT family protein